MSALVKTHFYVFVFSHPIRFLRTFSFSFFLPRRNSDPGSLNRALLPLPHYGACLHFCREKTSAFSSLVDSHRISPTLTVPV